MVKFGDTVLQEAQWLMEYTIDRSRTGDALDRSRAVWLITDPAFAELRRELAQTVYEGEILGRRLLGLPVLIVSGNPDVIPRIQIMMPPMLHDELVRHRPS